jgi:hypothetical protein
MLRGKGVVWNLPAFFTREGALLPEGFLKKTCGYGIGDRVSPLPYTAIVKL